jgi:glycosyltransferase involved in cell wall biosynthesis
MKSDTRPPLHVLFLPRWYPHRYDPMMGLFVERHGLAVSKQVAVSVLYVHADSEMKGKTCEIVQSTDGLYTVRIYFKKSMVRPLPIAVLINLFRFLYAHLKGYRLIVKERPKPDVIHVHVLSRLGAVAYLFKLFLGIPYVITEHWSRYLDYNNTYKGFLRKCITTFVVKRSSVVSVVSKDLAFAMQKHRLKHPEYHVINNVVDTDLFTPPEEKPDASKINFLHVSCFEDRSKNISGLLDVIEKLYKKRQDFRCTMVGTGMDFARLKKMAEEKGLDEKVVVFKGLLEGEAVVKEFQEAAFFVMFSNYENMPVVIGEAFACGLPVLATDVGGIGEHVTRDKGILVPAGNIDKMVEALDRMLENYSGFNPEKIRQYALENFSQKAVAKQLEKMYNFALKK